MTGTDHASTMDSWLEERYAAVADETYRHFNARVVATVDEARMWGVRTPVLRRIAREAAKRHDLQAWLDQLPHPFFESMQVHAFVVSAMRDYDQCVTRVEQLLPHIDNWATCDQLSPVVLSRHPDETLAHGRRWMASAHTYTCRFGIGTLMRHGLREHYDPSVLTEVATVDRGDDYYVNMMRAWFVAEAMVWRTGDAIALLKSQQLDRWTHNKAIQKAIESRRVDEDTKERLRTMRR